MASIEPNNLQFLGGVMIRIAIIREQFATAVLVCVLLSSSNVNEISVQCLDVPIKVILLGDFFIKHLFRHRQVKKLY